METPLQFAWELYTRKFEKILMLMLFTTLPLLIIHNFATNYMYVVTPSYSPIYSFADIYYGLLTVLLFIYAQVPYIRFVYNEYRGYENSLRNAIYHFIANGFTVFLFACIVSIFTTIGFMFFILPGFIFLALLFPIPYLSIFDDKSVWNSYKEGLRLGKKNFWKIALILIITGSIEFLFGIFITIQLFNITPSYAAQIITQMILNLLIFPFIIILLTSYIIKWRESSEVLEVSSERRQR
ncbi:hypothetical protein [Oceanobacillus damuensis]|uniref:hypothetical protein n=1 Tax=Oceanobacillus damuensis TaxID=937928 RepID=UPI000ADF3768|nr:hypothetical protein [Oceanobacillus damuensis]